jgi:hypothetical protein
VTCFVSITLLPLTFLGAGGGDIILDFVITFPALKRNTLEVAMFARGRNLSAVISGVYRRTAMQQVFLTLTVDVRNQRKLVARLPLSSSLLSPQRMT